MRIINCHGFPLDDHMYEHEDGTPVNRDSMRDMQRLVFDLNDNFEDAPFTIIGDTEIPNWVSDYEARQALGADD